MKPKPRRTDQPIVSPAIRLCPEMVRCDGNTLFGDVTMCGPCRAYLAKRAKQRPKKLRGEPTEYEVRMRK